MRTFAGTCDGSQAPGPVSRGTPRNTKSTSGMASAIAAKTQGRLTGSSRPRNTTLGRGARGAASRCGISTGYGRYENGGVRGTLNVGAAFGASEGAEIDGVKGRCHRRDAA